METIISSAIPLKDWWKFEFKKWDSIHSATVWEYNEWIDLLYYLNNKKD